MEIDIAKDGRAFYIELDGRVQMWNADHARRPRRSATIPVTLSHENGLLGIQLAPELRHHRPHLPGLLGAARTRSGTNRVSRFTLNGNDARPGADHLHLAAPAPGVLPHRRLARLRAPTATSTSPRATTPTRSRTASTRPTSGPAARSGTPSARRPTRTTRTARSCASGRSRTPTGTPGVGHDLHDPERATCSRPGTAQTLPEIYAMGFRNPFRIHVDQKTGWVLMGDYGPDAGSTEPEPRPAGQRRVQRRQAAGLLRLALLRPRERPVQGHHVHVATPAPAPTRATTTAPRRSTTRPTTRA